tara:strand:- start:110 stop:808 length:699 start_codon:yes stop_codon:yes gene_type:complete
MCGRKTLTMSKKAIIEELMVDEWQVEDYEPSYNIAPTQNSLVLVQEKGSKIVRSMKWGLIPSWSKNELYGSKMINARSETVTTKPSFKNLIPKNRCIVLSDGYYEWKQDGGRKAPFFIQKKDGGLMLFAGLWTTWSISSEKVFTYTILTTKAQKSISAIHNRMPALIDKSKAEMWINLDNKFSEVEQELTETRKVLNFYQVSDFVNKPNNNSVACIAPFKAPTRLNLFDDDQ